VAIDLEKIQDSEHILEILLQCEDILDSLDIYVYKNWFKGEIISGPNVKKYWIDLGLAYELDSMPDPRASLRLIKFGVKVKFEKIQRQVKRNLYTNKEQKTENDEIWVVTLSIPKRLISQIESSDDEFYDDEVDTDDVDSAKDAGMDNESAYMTDEQNGGAPSQDGGMPPPEDGPAPQGPQQ
jgi:hypothetical protein